MNTVISVCTVYKHSLNTSKVDWTPIHTFETPITTAPAGAMAKYCNECVCVCVCLSVCLSVSLSEPCIRAIFTVFMHVAYGRGSVLFQWGDEIPRGRGNFRGFSSPLIMYCTVYSI